MQNFIHDECEVVFTAGATIVAGDVVDLGHMFVIAKGGAAANEKCVGVTEGVFSLTKVGSQAWTAWASVYWDASNEYCTTTRAGNKFLGYAETAVGSGAGETTGRVLLAPGPQDLYFSSAVDFASINAAATGTVTIAGAGAAVGDAISVGFPATPTTGLVVDAYVSATNVITVRAVNITASPIDAASLTYTFTVHK